jgi:broad specificity phosphatase PhoE
MTVLAMLRHGETDWARERRIQGRTDTPLCDAGRAKIRRSILPGEAQGMRVVSSPLARCMETAALLGFEEVACEHRLAEMHWGEWEGRRLEELRSELGEAMRANEARGLDFTPPGGESPRNVLERVGGWLAETAALGQPTLAIAHRGVIRAIFCAASGWDMQGRPPLKLDWNALHVFRLDPAGRPSLYRMNIPLVEVSGPRT